MWITLWITCEKKVDESVGPILFTGVSHETHNLPTGYPQAIRLYLLPFSDFHPNAGWLNNNNL
jgi:hypothetical protein